MCLLRAQAHMKHIVAHGVGNAKRWAGGAGGGGAQPSGSLLEFTVGMEDRRASIRIPHSVLLQKRGWCAACSSALLHFHMLLWLICGVHLGCSAQWMLIHHNTHDAQV